jgi:hypothetical protein
MNGNDRGAGTAFFFGGGRFFQNLRSCSGFSVVCITQSLVFCVV